MDSRCGYEEIPHTADWALRVWAPDLPGLFKTAAQGMYAMMETCLEPEPRCQQHIDLAAEDLEGLLVIFLGELLNFVEAEGLGFDVIEIDITGLNLHAEMKGAQIASQSKLIKAVTYHKLEINATSEDVQTAIVFDV